MKLVQSFLEETTYNAFYVILCKLSLQQGTRVSVASVLRELVDRFIEENKHLLS